MSQDLKSTADAVLQKVVSGTLRVPGVVAMATDRRENTYEGAAGKMVYRGGCFSTADESAAPSRYDV